MMGVDITASHPSELSSRLSRAVLQVAVYAMTSLRVGMSVQSKITVYLGNMDLLRDSCPLILSLTKRLLYNCVFKMNIPLLFTWGTVFSSRSLVNVLALQHQDPNDITCRK